MRHAPVGDELFGGVLKRGLVGNRCLIDLDPVFKAGEFFSNLLLGKGPARIDCNPRARFGQRLGELGAKLAQSSGNDGNAAFNGKHLVHGSILSFRWYAFRP